MKYAIIVYDNYVSGLCQSENDMVNEVEETTYNKVSDMLLNKPQDAPDGYQYKLRADTLEWELVELPPEPEPSEDVDDSEALDIILGVSE